MAPLGFTTLAVMNAYFDRPVLAGRHVRLEPLTLEHAEGLLAACRAELASYKCPRSVDFAAELPREPNGKLYKRRLRERYWAGHTSLIV